MSTSPLAPPLGKGLNQAQKKEPRQRGSTRRRRGDQTSTEKGINEAKERDTTKRRRGVQTNAEKRLNQAQKRGSNKH